MFTGEIDMSGICSGIIQQGGMKEGGWVQEKQTGHMLATVEESDGYVGVHILSYFCTYFVHQS